MTYSSCIADEIIRFLRVFYIHFGLLPTDKENYKKELKLYGVSLTKAGNELFDIDPIEPKEAYNQALINYFKKKYLKLMELGITWKIDTNIKPVFITIL